MPSTLTQRTIHCVHHSLPSPCTTHTTHPVPRTPLFAVPSPITRSYSILGVYILKIFSILLNIDWPRLHAESRKRKEKLSVSEVGVGDYVGVQVAVCGRERGWAGPAKRGNAGPRPTLARLSVIQAEGGDSSPLWCSLRYSGGATLPVGVYFA